MLALAKVRSGAGGLALIDRELARPGRGEVVIEVHGAGICGTDLHIEAGEYPVAPGVIIGHEVAGAVVDLGEGVSPDWLGRSVVSETFFSTCGTCDRCREGRINLCAERRSIGTHVDGGFAQRLIVPATNLHEIPGWLDIRLASLTEPLACVCNCLFEPSVICPGDRVLVVGPGPIGLLAAQVAASSASEVVVLGLPADIDRLSTARDLGMSISTDAGELADFDVAIECSGSSGGISSALEALRRGGRYVQLGLSGRDVTVPFDRLVLKELAFSTAFGTTPTSWRLALNLIARRDVTLDALVSAVLPLAEHERAFADLRGGRATKIVFDPRLDAESGRTEILSGAVTDG